ncbi:TPA: hypothetical protein G8431_003536 [Salmonella enterica]|uniref:Fimbrial protein n=1 Tax=Salmonella enterica TaxID=28901 RepID=A0A763MV91_SALER|nr:hypothetical protein [Salmonella enterica]HAG4423392.1 hypothetical protein [Salmonella enterica]
MKKTLIALAVAASAAVSGSAMAWTASGTGGSVDLGGTLTPDNNVQSPWEVKVGVGADDLNGRITKGDTKVEVIVSKNVPVLNIRNINPAGFMGGTGKNNIVNINFKGLDLNGFSNNKSKITVDINDGQNRKIGRAEIPFYGMAVLGAAYSSQSKAGENKTMYTSDSSSAFYGGLPKSYSLLSGPDTMNLLASFDSEATTNLSFSNAWTSTAVNEKFSNSGMKYWAAYGSGIKAGDVIKISLDAPADTDAITWKASLPVTVTYM